MDLACSACGATEGVRQFQNYPACPEHTPAKLAGHPEPPVPDPDSTMAGIMRAHGAYYDRALTPASDTNIDAQRRASGKKRTSAQGARAAREQVESTTDARVRAEQRERATVGARSGETYVPEFDYARLNGQAKRVFDLMADGKWRTLREISEATGDPEASVSARLRDFRQDKYGHLTVLAKRMEGSSAWLARLVLPERASVQQELVPAS